MTQQTSSKRRQLLNAASQIVLAQGSAHLTLDAVAATAGVSKGGLLYHFPSKEMLIKAMIDDYLNQFNEQVSQIYATLPDEPGRWLRAFVIASFADTTLTPSLFAAWSAAMVNQPELLAPVREQYAVWRAQASADGTAQEVVRVVFAATDSAWFNKSLQFSSDDDALMENLLTLIATGTVSRTGGEGL